MTNFLFFLFHFWKEKQELPGGQERNGVVFKTLPKCKNLKKEKRKKKPRSSSRKCQLHTSCLVLKSGGRNEPISESEFW
jgi:hypothetical protein